MLKYSTIRDDDTSNVKALKYTILDKMSKLDNNVENNLYTFILKRLLKCVIQVSRIVIYKPNLQYLLLKISCKNHKSSINNKVKIICMLVQHKCDINAMVLVTLRISVA